MSINTPSSENVCVTLTSETVTLKCHRRHVLLVMSNCDAFR